jgi:poly-gamma-glutamate synthesis protein (capsule biosynthesis protein)
LAVSFHWGEEYQDNPTERQRYLAHLAVDSGAKLVIGNHPHRIQPVEIYKEGIITAHGNFIFDQEWSRETKIGVVGKYSFSKSGIMGVKFLPVLIENYGQPRFLEGDAKEEIISKMRSLSLQLAEN